MTKRARIRALGLAAATVASAALTSVASGQAPDPWKWPEKPQNLQVLPKNFNGERVRAVMRGFTRSLGVRCVYCHVGQEGKPLSTFDFVSDQNPNKNRAREMYRMLGDISDHLEKIQPSALPRVNMWCHTCHQGRPRPTTLQEELASAKTRGGVSAALERYRELRKRYYGSAGYDFSEGSLNDFGSDLLEAKDTDGAIAVFHENAVQFPQSGDVWESLAEAYAKAGKKDLARIYYQKSLELSPDNPGALKQLRELESSAR